MSSKYLRRTFHYLIYIFALYPNPWSLLAKPTEIMVDN